MSIVELDSKSVIFWRDLTSIMSKTKKFDDPLLKFERELFLMRQILL